MTAHKSWLWWCVVWLWMAPHLRAQGLPSDDQGALRYRRVLVPQDRLSELTRGYLPLDRTVFGQLVDRTQTFGEHPNAGAAWIDSAEYRARFTPDQQLSGQAVLHVTHASAEPTLLSLSPCNLALADAAWQNAESNRPARLGTDEHGELVTEVTEPGDFAFSWTLQGAADELGGCRFNVALTAAPRSRLVIAVPRAHRLTVDRGILTPPEPSTAASTEEEAVDRWVLELGGHSRCEITAIPRMLDSRRQQFVSMQQDTQYRLGENGLDVQCDAQLAIHGSPLEELYFDVDADLQITDVRLGNLDVAWTTRPGDSQETQTVRLQFAERLTGTHPSLQLVAIGPSHVGRTWRLPVFQPRNVSWREGAMSLSVPPSLVLQQLTPHEARQSSVSDQDGREAGRTLHFELFGPDGSLEVLLARTRPELQADIGTTIEVQPGGWTAVAQVELSCRTGERRSCEALIPNAWTLEGIEEQAGNAIGDYQIVAYEADHKRLRIQFSRPVTESQSLNMRIRARRSPGERLTAEDFRPVEFVDVSAAARFIAIVPEATYRLELAGDQSLRRLDPDQLPADAAARLQVRRGAVVFVDDYRADDVTITISREAPTFQASIQADVTVAATTLDETYRITCTPESTPVSQLLVHLSEPRGTQPTWRLARADNRAFRARLVEETPAAASPGRDVSTSRGETWEITLGEAQATPFEVIAERRTPLAGVFAVSLATVPAASTQQGSCTIHAVNGTRISIKTDAVHAIPCDTPLPERSSAVVACYRYDASRAARIVIDRLQPRMAPTSLWVWNCLLQSRYLANGQSTHVASYFLEAAGSSRFSVRLPAGSDLRGLDVNGVNFSGNVRAGEGEFLEIPLPAEARYPLVEITYSTQRASLRTWDQLVSEFPEVRVPELNRTWQVCLPSGYRTTQDMPRAEGATSSGLSWSRRLFGPLARREGTPGFPLFAPHRWALTWQRWRGTPATAPQAADWLQRLDAALSEGDKGGQDESTLRQWLSGCLPTETERGPTAALWIDAGALRDNRVALDSPLVIPPASAATSPASAWLNAQQLCLVQFSDQVLLTSRSQLAGHAESVVATDRASVALLPDETTWCSNLVRQTEDPTGALLPLTVFVSAPAAAKSPWAGRRAGSVSNGAGSEIPYLELAVNAGEAKAIGIERTAVVGALSLSLLLIAAGLVSCLRRYPPRLVVPVMFALVATATVAPAAWAPAVSYLMWGVACGVGLGLFRRRIGWPRVDLAAPEKSLSQSAATAIVLAIAVIAAMAAGRSWAQTPNPKPPSDESGPVYPLIVPVDENQQPTGQYNYLPVDFYDALHRRANDADRSARDWLATDATYRAVFNWRQNRTTLDLTSLTAQYRVEVLQPGKDVEMPWDGQAGRCELLEARLDGQPVQPLWNAERTRIALPLRTAGAHDLEFVLRPATREQPGEQSLVMSIFPVATARLFLEVPVGAPKVQVPSAQGTSQLNPETGVVITALGPARQLEMRWQAKPLDDQVTRPIDVQQLVWLKVHPKGNSEAVLLDTLFRLESSGRPLEQIAMRLDSRLRLQSDHGDEVDWTHEPVAGTEDNLLTVRWRDPLKSVRPLRLRFLVADTTGLGNVSLPRLEFTDGLVSRRWLAVSISPDLEFTPNTSDFYRPLDAAEFLAVWGEAEAAPNLCYRVAAEDPSWSLATRSRQSRSEANQAVDLRIEKESMLLALDADVDTTNGEVFQHRVQVPEGFEITSWAVTQGENELSEPGHYDGSGTLTVFLREGVSGEHHVRVEGRLPLRVDGQPIAMPAVHLLDMQVLNHLVRVYRASDVLVEVALPPGLAPHSTVPIGAYREGFGRLVSAFDWPAAGKLNSGGVTLTVHPNSVRLEARVVTLLRRVENQWEAAADYEARVLSDSGGLADLFRLEIPAEWIGPFTTVPEVPYEIHELPGQRRHLVVRPAQPVSDRFRVRIQGLMKREGNTLGQPPNVVPLGVAVAERYLVLPRQLEQQRLDWGTPGMTEVPLRDAWPDGTNEQPSASDLVAYRVSGRGRAVVADVQRAMGKSQVLLADVFVAYTAPDTCTGVVTFVLDPAGSPTCTLQVPAGCELVQVEVATSAAALVPLGDGRWQIRLASDQLLQTVQVIFRRQPPASVGKDSQVLDVPWIVDWEVAQTLWTVRGPRQVSWSSPGNLSREVPAAQQELLRLQLLNKAVGTAVDTMMDNPISELRAWYTPWVRPIAAAATRISHLPWPANDQAVSGAIIAAELERIVREQDAIAARLDAAISVRKALNQPSRLPETRDVWAGFLDGQAPTTCLTCAGALPTLEITWHPVTSWPAQSVWWQLGLIALAAGGWFYGPTREYLAACCQSWSVVMGVVLGIAWSLWISPGFLGGLLVAGSLAGPLLKQYPQRWFPRRNAATSSSPTDTVAAH